MKVFYHFLSIVLLLLTQWKAVGQTYTLSSLLIDGSPSSLTVSGSSKQSSYNVQLSRPHGNSNEATVDIFAGDASGNITGAALTSVAFQTNPNSWSVSGSTDYQTASGVFTASSSTLVSPNNYVYAVARDVNNQAFRLGISNGISVTFTPSSSGGGGGYGGAASGYGDQCVQSGTQPHYLNSGELSSGDDIRVLWYVRYPGYGETQFREIPGANDAIYQPPVTYTKAIYMCVNQARDCNYVFFGCYWKSLGTSQFIIDSALPYPNLTPFSANMCVGTQISFSWNAVPGANGYTWELPANSGLSINGSTGTVVVTGTSLTVAAASTAPVGTYPIRVYSNGGPACGGTYSTIVNVTVSTPVISSVPAPSFVRIGTSCYYDVQVAVTPNITKYHIDMSNGEQSDGASSANGKIYFGLMESGPATYSITVTVGNECGTTRSATFTNRNVPKSPAGCMARVSNPSQVTDTDASPTKAESLFTVSPNPATDYLTVDISSEAEAREVQLITVQGTPAKAKLTTSTESILVGSVNMDVSSVIPGVYILRVLTKDGYLYKRVEIAR